MASPGEITLKLVTFTEGDCKLIVSALEVLREEHLLDAAETAHVNRLIERLS